MTGNVGSSETICRISLKNWELAILLGILFTDGCVSPKGKQSWRLYLASTSDVLIHLFSDCVTSVFSIDQSRVRVGCTPDKLHKVVVDSKEIGSWLVSMFGTFRTLRYPDGSLPRAKLPVLWLIESKLAEHFLQTAFSCDGGVSLYPAYRKGSQGGTQWLIRTVFLSCAHPKLRVDYLELLEFVGIRAREVPKDGKIKIENKVDIRLFAERIGFTPGVCVAGDSKFWRGYEKNEVLNLILNSYGQPSAIYRLPKFNGANDIVRPSWQHEEQVNRVILPV